ncbi:inositol polyphosphate multikinase isoform X2 [Denticeps clupeoides]|nr:inositol polyphosphate multikinase isoform X2 [Denticeps clupeoides]XP_028826467.1 inositol polyphosphate multikinase isoform X2 [Denticeps clupeoides]XP_028826468.1 inositol polyphosphate multikinase isoform X2 [Denticeps clupeoides]
MQFYSTVFAVDCRDPVLLDLQHHLPRYYGTWSSPDCPNDSYLKLEDITQLFRKPCIMDVKIGQRSYDPFASQEKREQQIKKYPLMEEIGFLLQGMRVYNVSTDSFTTYDQHYGRGLVKDTIKEGLSKFFYNGECLRKDAVTASIRRVQKILQWFEGQRQLNFYASSLLFVYEGLPLASSSTGTPDLGPAANSCEYNNNNIDQSLTTMYALHKQACTRSHLSSSTPGNGTWKCQRPNDNRAQSPKLEKGEADEAKEARDERRTVESEPKTRAGEEADVRMIDFAHVFPSESRDAGYTYGLKNLLRALQQVLND